jgi:hypothetical protein
MITMTLTVHRRVGMALGAILALIAVLHAYWALGGRWGLAEALGGPDKPVPPAWLIWVVTALLVLAVLVVLGRVGFWGRQWPGWLFAWGSWGLATALFLAALINFSGQTKWERLGFGPFCLLLAAATAVVARSPQRAA